MNKNQAEPIYRRLLRRLSLAQSAEEVVALKTQIEALEPYTKADRAPLRSTCGKTGRKEA